MITVCTPYSLDKNLGKAYNEAAAMITTEWICFIDHDVMFLRPDAIKMMHSYAELYPDTGLFTCFTNRIHPLAKDQLLDNVSDHDGIRHHQMIAGDRISYFPNVTSIEHEISGFLMLFKKSTWEKIKFVESGECLGVDNDFSRKILEAAMEILRMDGLYVWHSYRLNNIKDKSHLK